MKYIIIVACSIFLFSSCNEKTLVRKKIGNDIVEAQFLNDSLIDGKAKYFNNTGILEAYYTFKNGVKNGNAVTFHENGKLKDSMYYSDNLLNGPAYKFDVNGKLLFTIMYYYGLDVGDHLFFKNGVVDEYHFNNFDQKQIVSCKYDSVGSCDSLVFNAYPLITNGLIEKQNPAIKMFIYFPHPPDFEVIYKMGFIKNQQRLQEFTLNSDRLFLDTTFAIPEKDVNHFLTVDYKNKSNDSTVNVYFKKF